MWQQAVKELARENEFPNKHSLGTIETNDAIPGEQTKQAFGSSNQQSMKLETMSSQPHVAVTREACVENKKEHNWNRAQIRRMHDSDNEQNARMHQSELGRSSVVWNGVS